MNPLRLALLVMFHPTDAFPLIKADRSRFNYVPTAILLFLMMAVRVIYIYTVHYPLADVLPRDANIWLEMVMLLLPVLTWVLACYAVTTIMNGESLIREILMAAAYAMLPYIIFTIPLAGLSHLMGGLESKLYGALQTLIWIWVYILFFISVMTMNDYTFWQSVGICALSLVAIGLIWAIGGLFFALSSQLYHFVEDIILELRMMYIE